MFMWSLNANTGSNIRRNYPLSPAKPILHKLTSVAKFMIIYQFPGVPEPLGDFLTPNSLSENAVPFYYPFCTDMYIQISCNRPKSFQPVLKEVNMCSYSTVKLVIWRSVISAIGICLPGDLCQWIILHALGC